MSRDKASADTAEDKNNSEEPAVEDSAGVDSTVANGDSGADTKEAAEPALSELETVQLQLQEASAKADQNWDAVLRTRAEMENLRKRQSRELENAHKYALDKIAMDLLPVRDTLEMGIAAAATEADPSKIVEGTELTLKMLTQALEKFNIVEVDPAGEKFDPDLHQAISMQEGTDKPANTVLNVMQKGYTLNDRLLRPAMVVIAK